MQQTPGLVQLPLISASPQAWDTNPPPAFAPSLYVHHWFPPFSFQFCHTLLGLCHSNLSVSSFQMNLPFSKFRFYLCALHKTPVPVWWKIYFTLPSLTSMGLMVLSSTCSSVVLIEAHWLDESSPKICSLFLTVPGSQEGRYQLGNAAYDPSTVPAWGWYPGALVWQPFSHQVLYFWPLKPCSSFQFVLSGDAFRHASFSPSPFSGRELRFH